MMATVACGGRNEHGQIEKAGERHAEDEERALAQPHGDGRGDGDAEDQRGQAESVEPAEELLVAGDVFEVGQHDAAAHGDARRSKTW